MPQASPKHLVARRVETYSSTREKYFYKIKQKVSKLKASRQDNLGRDNFISEN